MLDGNTVLEMRTVGVGIVSEGHFLGTVAVGTEYSEPLAVGMLLLVVVEVA